MLTTLLSELVSPSLKRRFFLKIPKWIDVHNGKEADLFGIQTLAFPLANPDVDIPEFLSGEILSFIETQTFNANDNKPYNPHNNLSTDLDQFCTSFSNGYLIPLYLLNSISANVLKMTNFSDKDLLLMNKVNEDRYPKPVLRNFMCQYLLSGTYMDMFDETKKISVFCEDADTLEAHHIIPLGSAKKVGEITADIRKNPRHICNSPLNFVYITKAANKDISDDALDAYEKKIQPAAKAALFISSYTPASHDTEIKVRGLLESRYSMMQGTISGEINDLLTNWM